MLISLDQVHDKNIEVGELLTTVAVTSANVIKDIRENIKNLIGGQMIHYEKLIQQTIDRAMENLNQKAKDKGYHGVIGVKVSHPVVVDGAAEIIVYGNGFNFK